jgi:hypothetical protein
MTASPSIAPFCDGRFKPTAGTTDRDPEAFEDHRQLHEIMHLAPCGGGPMVTLLVASARFPPGGALGGRDFGGAVLLPVFTAFFGLRVIEVASAAAVAWQFSGADREARGRAACSR